MSSRTAVLALGSLVLAAAPAFGQFRDPQAARFGWVASLEEGKARARQTGKPLMVVLRCQP
jgi:hypothetical protein